MATTDIVDITQEGLRLVQDGRTLPGMTEDDDVIVAMRDLLAAVGRVDQQLELIRQRAAAVMRRRYAEEPWLTILGENDGPPVVQLITNCLDLLNDAGARLRRSQAEHLYGEGLTMDQIATTFGVSRQRVQQLLAGSEVVDRQRQVTRPQRVVDLGDAGSDGDE